MSNLEEFKGITQKYRNSSEYKQWFNAIQAENPQMQPIVIDQAILAYKLNPKIYQDIVVQEKKEEKLKKKSKNIDIPGAKKLDTKPSLVVEGNEEGEEVSK